MTWNYGREEGADIIRTGTTEELRLPTCPGVLGVLPVGAWLTNCRLVKIALHFIVITVSQVQMEFEVKECM